jgi:hypothetical protein
LQRLVQRLALLDSELRATQREGQSKAQDVNPGPEESGKNDIREYTSGAE